MVTKRFSQCVTRNLISCPPLLLYNQDMPRTHLYSQKLFLIKTTEEELEPLLHGIIVGWYSMRNGFALDNNKYHHDKV